MRLNTKAGFFLATLGSFMVPFMSSAIVVALRTIQAEFNMDAVMLGWVSTSYMLVAAALCVPFGKFADIYGRKKVYLLGISLFSAASILCSIAWDSWSLILFRVFQGLGGAAIFGTGVAIVTSLFPPEKRGMMLGINVASVYVGLSLGPFAGGILTGTLGWRSIFYSIVPIGILIIIVTLIMLKVEWKESQGEQFDITGSIFYAFSLVASIWGLSKLPGFEGIISLGAGIAGFILFFYLESRMKYPILNIRLFLTNRTFTFSSLAALINYSATSSVSFLLSLYLQYVRGLPPQTAGWILVIAPVVQAAFSPFTGWFSDRIQPRKLASYGMASTSLGLLVLVFINERTNIWILAIGLVFLGFGFALFSSPNTNAVMASVEKRFYGIASGILNTMRLVGQNLSMAVTMLIFSRVIGSVQITPDVNNLFLQSQKINLTIMTVLCVIGIFASLARGKLKQLEEGPVT